MKKRFLFVGAMAALALNVYAADSDYTVDANGVITKYSGFDTEVTIPATIGGKKITAIGEDAFRKADLTSVVIPEGITEIGSDAFRENKLTTVTIPGSVKTIGSGAFNANRDLVTVVLSEGLETVGSGAFPLSIKSINIPASIRSLNAQFPRETSVTLAANITIDMSEVFRKPYENALGQPNPAIFLNYIANDRRAGIYTGDMKCEEKRADGYRYNETQYGAVLDGYYGDSTRVRIPAEIGGIPIKVLYNTFGRSSIDAVQIPESVTYIGRRTFDGQSLASITIPTGVTYIGDGAFRGNNLTSVTIPEGVTYIGDEAFRAGRYTENYLTSVTIPAGVQYIGDQAFFGNKLTSVTIPAGVTYLGALVFAENSIKTITIPPSVKTLGHNPLFGTLNTDQDLDAVNGVSIVIGADVVVGGEVDYNGYEQNFFKTVYDRNGRKAGRYTVTKDGYRSYNWVYSAR